MAEARPLWAWLTRVCAGAALPVLVEQAGATETVLAAASLHTRALETWHAWRRQGVRPGDVMEDPSPAGLEAVVRLLACLAGGLVWRPLKAGAAALCRPGAWRLTPSAERLEGSRFDGGNAPGPSGLWLESSGTEGPPRAVLVSQAALCWQLEAHQRALALGADDVRVLTLPWTHAFGVVLDLLLGLVSKQTLVVAPLTGAWSPRSLAVLLADREATWWSAVPRLLELVMDASPPRCRAPRKVLVGGAPVSPALRAAAARWVGPEGRLHVGYGMTEAGPGLALDGALLPGVAARLEAGRLLVQSPAWCGADGDGLWHDTGDLASFDASGHLDVIGRASRRVKAPDATWVSLDALEAELAGRPGVKAAAITRHGAGWQVSALVETGTPSLGGLEGFLSRRLGDGVTVRLERATPQLLAALAATPAKSLSAALATVTKPPAPSVGLPPAA
jgi:acyl-coenzyme A synthetase/AMP-(fatty) acid ligase